MGRLSLRLQPDASAGDAHDPDKTVVVQYEVLGLPPNQLVLIGKVGGRWRIRRGLGEWAGDYESPEVALAALQAYVTAWGTS